MGADLFSGPDSLRVAGERRSFWACVLAAPVAIALVGIAFPSVSVSEFVLLIVGAMLFVSVGRGRLLGSSIRIDGRQLPEIDRLVSSIAARLGVATPQIFIRDDFFIPIAAVGVGDPYALVLSSQYIDHLEEGELAFLIGRELGHIAAGHSRITSLLSTSGRENPVIALVFGAWLRRMEYTADRVGLLVCDGVADAIGAVAITTFHSIGRRVDMAVLAEQRRELEAEPTLRMGEWVGGMPYATNRLQALQAFDVSPLAAAWRPKLRTNRTGPAAAGVVDAATVSRRHCAGFWRRTAALFLDLVIISAILKSPVTQHVVHVKSGELSDFPEPLRLLIEHMPAISLGFPAVIAVVTYFLYGAIFVGISGQTLGMMIMDLRVVTTGFVRPSPAQAVWRYAAAFGSVLSAFVLLGFFFRVHPHDWLSRTRVVFGRRSA